jgi:hypothetical protein
VSLASLPDEFALTKVEAGCSYLDRRVWIINKFYLSPVTDVWFPIFLRAISKENVIFKQFFYNTFYFYFFNISNQDRYDVITVISNIIYKGSRYFLFFNFYFYFILNKERRHGQDYQEGGGSVISPRS